MGGYDRLKNGSSVTQGEGNPVTRVFVFLGTGNSPGSGLPLFKHRITITGQGDVWVVGQQGHTDLFGYSVAFLGGGVGHPDSLVVGAPAYNGLAGTEAGRVWIFPGSTDLQVSEAQAAVNAEEWPDCVILDGPEALGWFGKSIATAQDSSGEFLRDLLIGAPGKGPVEATGATKGWVYQVNSALTDDLVDLGVAESGVAVALIPSSGTAGIAGPYTTAPRYVLTPNRGMEGDLEGDQFGHAVAFVGNIDGVAGQEFLVGAPQYANEIGAPGHKLASPTMGPGYARLFKQTSGTALITFAGTQLATVDPNDPPGSPPFGGEAFGFSVGGGANLDGDLNDVPDLIIGAPLFEVDKTGGVGSGDRNSGRVRVYSGTGAGAATPFEDPIFGDSAPNFTVLVGEAELDQFGSAVVGVKDLDGDLADDVLIGAWRAATNDATCDSGRLGQAGSASLFSISAAGSPLAVFYGEVAKDHLGRAVSAGNLFGTSSVPEIVLAGVAWSQVAPGTLDEVGRGYVWDGDSLP